MGFSSVFPGMTKNLSVVGKLYHCGGKGVNVLGGSIGKKTEWQYINGQI
jgi:hypothetical protein